LVKDDNKYIDEQVQRSIEEIYKRYLSKKKGDEGNPNQYDSSNPKFNLTQELANAGGSHRSYVSPNKLTVPTGGLTPPSKMMYSPISNRSNQSGMLDESDIRVIYKSPNDKKPISNVIPQS